MRATRKHTYSVTLKYTLVETIEVEAESESAAEEAAWMETKWSPSADCAEREILDVSRKT